jgi:hypothetical protein
MSLNPFEVIKKANDVATKIFENEKFAVPMLQMRAKKAADNHPNDQTLRMMYNVLQKMNANGRLFISRAEVRDLYSKFATANNKAVDYFSTELHLTEPPKAKVMKYAENADVDIVSDAISNATNSAMYNALSQVWGEDGKLNKSASLNMYSPEHAKKAESLVGLTLSRIGVEPHKINKFAGSESFIICDAIYRTPVGESHVLIPVEFSKSGALLPSIFVSKHGFVDLTAEAVKDHIKETAGHNMQINASTLLDTLGSIRKLSSMNEIELQVAIAKSAADREKGMVKMASASEKEGEQVALTTNPIFLNEIDAEQIEMSLPESPAKQTFASLLETPKGMAEHLFGRKTVDNARAIVINRFASIGYKPQVVLANCDDDSLIYAARIDTQNGPLGFEVLVDVSDKTKIHLPNVIAAKDKVYEFSSDGISQAISHNVSDDTMLAKVSPMYELKPSEVLERLRVAADNRDYKTAEDALNVLSVNGPQETYTMALAEYMRSLSGGVLKQASVKSKCSMVVKTANRSCPICGHLNLPLDKVYQDEFGNCKPLYRKAMEENYEGMLFNTSKVYL